jgi:hypothetical protein
MKLIVFSKKVVGMVGFPAIPPNVLQLPEGRYLENKIINLKIKLC